MQITASLVKELRERSGAGMMECKKALTENAGNIEAAADWLRATGLVKADKKATRIAAEGRVALAHGAGRSLRHPGAESSCATPRAGPSNWAMDRLSRPVRQILKASSASGANNSRGSSSRLDKPCSWW